MARGGVSKQKTGTSVNSGDFSAEVCGDDDERGDEEADFLRGSRCDVGPRGGLSAEIAISIHNHHPRARSPSGSMPTALHFSSDTRGI